MQKFKDILRKYFPVNAVDPVFNLIVENDIHLKITKSRNTKLGDFRPPLNGSPARITINNNLNSYSVLITFLHEVAHLQVWKKYQNTVRPHGTEWKRQFEKLNQQFMYEKFLPPDILKNLRDFEKRIYASSGADTDLARILRRYNKPNGTSPLEKLPDESEFELPDGRHFKKLKKLRKNFLCFCYTNNKKYIFNPLAEVIPVKKHSI